MNRPWALQTLAPGADAPLQVPLRTVCRTRGGWNAELRVAAQYGPPRGTHRTPTGHDNLLYAVHLSLRWKGLPVRQLTVSCWKLAQQESLSEPGQLARPITGQDHAGRRWQLELRELGGNAELLISQLSYGELRPRRAWAPLIIAEGAARLAGATEALTAYAQAQQRRSDSVTALLERLSAQLGPRFSGVAVPPTPAWPDGAQAVQLGGLTIWRIGRQHLAYHPRCGWYLQGLSKWKPNPPYARPWPGEISVEARLELLAATAAVGDRLRLTHAALTLRCGLWLDPELSAP